MEIKFNYELLKDYLDGLLDEQTSIEIGELIKNNEEANYMARGILILKKEFENDELKIEAYLDELLKKQQSKINVESNSRSVSWLKIAAAITAIAVLSVLLYQISQPTFEDLVRAELSVPYEGAMVFRDVEITQLSKGLTAYKQNNYEKASKLLGELEDSEAIFYNGLSHLYMGLYQEAAEIFNSNSLKESRYAVHSQWFIILCKIKLGNEKEAKMLLEEYTSGGNTFKKDEAKDLLNLIQD